jgi:hypothetical protein
MPLGTCQRDCCFTRHDEACNAESMLYEVTIPKMTSGRMVVSEMHVSSISPIHPCLEPIYPSYGRAKNPEDRWISETSGRSIWCDQEQRVTKTRQRRNNPFGKEQNEKNVPGVEKQKEGADNLHPSQGASIRDRRDIAHAVFRRYFRSWHTRLAIISRCFSGERSLRFTLVILSNRVGLLSIIVQSRISQRAGVWMRRARRNRRIVSALLVVGAEAVCLEV